MKELTELKFEEMTLEQKIGFVNVAFSSNPILDDPDNFDYVLDLIRKRAVGAVWVTCIRELNKDFEGIIKTIRETADYPILIFTDAESGFGDYRIGHPISLGYVDREDAAYAYGKAIAIQSKQAGYNVICNPLLDRTGVNAPCGAPLRSIHPDKERSLALAAAMCRGMHDGGVLTCAKHYPSPGGVPVDSHMSESYSPVTREELISDRLYAYKKLAELGLMDAVMVSHKRVVNVDEKYPSTVSKAMYDILRNEIGFDGVAITDALIMMGIVTKFGYKDPKWMCIEAGADLSLGYTKKTSFTYDAIMEAYESGKLSQKMLDAAVKRILAAQHKAYELEKATEGAVISSEEDRLVKNVNKESIAAICDEGLSPTVSRDGHHLFVILTDHKRDLRNAADSMTVSWYKPELLAEKVRKLFPNSGITQITEFPSSQELESICMDRLNYDDVVFVSFYKSMACTGREAFTPRITSLLEAWQMSDAVSALVHFGNPFLLEDLPHIPRIINACPSTVCTQYALDVLAGDLEPHGKIPYNIKLRKSVFN